MSMSKKDFIALADAIRDHNAYTELPDNPEAHRFEPDQLITIVRFLGESNPRFNRERWLGYIAGTNGPSGGAR
jgi:hypothetical protein